MKPAPSLICQILAASTVMAGTSANYTLAPDSVDGGGLRGTSASYTANFSSTSGGAGSSSAYTARTGFAGQLLDPSGISLAASPLTVEEEATRQLSATLLYDDSTTAPLAAGEVAWSVDSGPLAGINRGGLATAASVFRDTAAVARGTYRSLTSTLGLTVLNILPDNFELYARDGIPDDWQIHYFGVNNPLAAPQLDPDGDTWDNLFEYNACIDPTDPVSTFSMSISEVNGGGHKVSFSPRFSDCSYTLLGSSDLSLWAPVAGTVTDSGLLRTIVEPLGTGERRFYHIRVQRQ
jgi:hypothetical protein